MNKLVGQESAHPLSQDEVNKILKESMFANWTEICDELRRVDIGNKGIIPKEIFRNVLNYFAFRLNDDQVPYGQFTVIRY